MAKGFTKRVVLHREVIDDLMLGALDGLTDLAKEVILDASERAPDSPYDPYPAGEGLPKQGGVLAYAAGGKINGWSIRGGQPSQRAVTARATQGGFVIIGGFGFPGHFAEHGTLKERARPFLTPALADKLPGAEAFIAQGVRRRQASAGERAATAAAISSRIRAARA